MDHKYIRDSHSNAIINTDVAGLAAYKAKKKQSLEMKNLKYEVESLKEDIGEIKDLLKQICIAK